MAEKQKRLDSGKPSKTAEFMALFRALESAYPRERRLFEDPFARRFLSPALRAAAFAARAAFLQKGIVRLLDTIWSGARASGIARTRLIDDFLQAGLRDGISQLVILGAGCDSRAYRMDTLQNCRVFEVDHPSTLAFKQAKLEKIHSVPRGHVRYAATDFNRQSAAQTLREAGFDPSLPAFFIWEGVTNYLTEEAVRKTLAEIGALAPGTRLAFTYVHRDAIDAPEQTVKKGVSKLLQKQGEPWTFGILPQTLPALLGEYNLTLLENLDSVSCRKRYMCAQGRHLDGYEFYHAALAEVHSASAKSQRHSSKSSSL